MRFCQVEPKFCRLMRQIYLVLWRWGRGGHARKLDVFQNRVPRVRFGGLKVNHKGGSAGVKQ
jgi:hypothetical protein